MSRPNDKPYTERGIVRQVCARGSCLNKAKFQWQCCAGGNRWTAICADCDVDLNRLVLEWMEDKDIEAKMDAYAEYVYGPPIILKDAA